MLAQTFQVLDTSGAHSCANEFMLTLKTPGQDFFIETVNDQIIIGRPLARQDCSIHINEREDNGMFHSLIFGLDVVNNPVEFNIRVVARNQCR